MSWLEEKWDRFEEKVIDPIKDDPKKALMMAINPMMGAQGVAANESFQEGGVLEPISQMGDDLRGKTASDAAEEASATTASAMMEQLNYLKEINKLPQELKEQALTKLGTLYGGGEEGQQAQQEMFDQGKTSPMYKAMMGGRDVGDEAVARYATRTGGMRSGGMNEALYTKNQQQESKALMDAYMMELTGINKLAGLPTGEQQIGQTMADVGTVKGQGIMGAAGAQQQGTQNMLNLGLAGTSMFI